MKVSLLFISCMLLFSQCGGTVEESIAEENVAEDTIVVNVSPEDEKTASDALVLLKEAIDNEDYETAYGIRRNLLLNYTQTKASIEATKLWNGITENPEVASLIGEIERVYRTNEVLVSNDEKAHVLEARLNTLNGLFEKGFPQKEYMAEIEDMETWTKEVKEAMEIRDTELNRFAKEVNSKLVERKRKRFPEIRQQFVREADRLVWREDMDVLISGTDMDEVTFVGGAFSRNANIEDFNNEIDDKLRKLRFKRVNYKWIKHERDYTTYSLSTSKDEA